MPVFKIKWSIGGSYNRQYNDTVELDTMDEAIEAAYEQCCQMFDSYRESETNELIKEQWRENYGDDPMEGDEFEEFSNEVFQEEVERWCDWDAELVE